MRLRPIFILCLILPLCARSSQEHLSSVQLREDLAAIKSHMAAIHPDPGFAGQSRDIAQAMTQVDQQLSKPMTRDQAWRVLATLNPAFADAHMQVLVPNVDQQTRAHLDAGGKLFPFEVQVDTAGGMRIRSALGGAPSAYAGAHITHINGMAAVDVTRALLARAAGDSEAFRANHLSWQLWLPYWKMFGAPARFDIAIAGKGLVQVAASSALPERLDHSFDKLFQFELLSGDAARLTINAFAAADPIRFRAFTRDAFARLRANKARVLIIDVRQNGGGDDVHWKEGILPYLANRPYRHTSSYIKKVIAGRESASEPLGSVISAEHLKWDQPDLDNPLRFGGDTYVLVGRMTYSSAVLFANVMQDFGFGKLVGERGYARTRQSGGTQYPTLAHSGLALAVPRMVLERPAGARAQPLIEPDIVLADDPFNQRAMPTSLLALLAREHKQKGHPPTVIAPAASPRAGLPP